MDREIKFRAKTKSLLSEWVHGDLINSHDGDVMICVGGLRLFGDPEASDFDNVYEVKPETVGQFIGLYDKNGKEIYEGDICRDCLYIGVVTYGNPDDMVINGGEYGVDYLGFYLNIDNSKTSVEDRCAFEDWEVIGNVIENIL